MLPTLGITVQVTAVFPVPETVAVNCCVCPTVSPAVDGVTVTLIEGEAGNRVKVAIADAMGFAVLAAVRVMVVLDAMLLGAV